MDLSKFSQLPPNLFGLLFWNYFFVYVVILIITGLLALFNIKPVDFNGEPTYGVLGFIASVLMSPIMAFVTAVSTWLLLILGNFVLRLFFNRKN